VSWCNNFIGQFIWLYIFNDLCHVFCRVEPPQSPHNVTVSRVTSTSVTLNVTSSAPPANQRSSSASAVNQLPITSWRVRYTMADEKANELTSEFSADGENYSIDLKKTFLYTKPAKLKNRSAQCRHVMRPSATLHAQL